MGLITWFSLDIPFKRLIYVEHIVSKYGWDIVKLKMQVESLEREVKELRKLVALSQPINE